MKGSQRAVNMFRFPVIVCSCYTYFCVRVRSCRVILLRSAFRVQMGRCSNSCMMRYQQGNAQRETPLLERLSRRTALTFSNIGLSKPGFVSIDSIGFVGPIGTCVHVVTLADILDSRDKRRLTKNRLTWLAGAEKGIVAATSPLYFPLFTSRVTSVPFGFVTVTGIERGFARYL